MIRIFLTLCGFLLMSAEVSGIPAYPQKIVVTINGQEYRLRLRGDEHAKWAETEEGYTVIQDGNRNWCYAQLSNDSTLSTSRWLLGNNEAQNSDFNNFLATTPKHLVGKRPQQDLPVSSYRNSQTAIGQRRMLIIMMEFQDVGFSKGRMDFEKLFNEEGYSDDHAQGSVRDFYLYASYYQLQLYGDIYGPYRATHNMAYYGGNRSVGNGEDANPYALFEEAITYAAQNTDLSVYDGDEDGYIDNVHIIFSGYGEEAGATSDAIWSHEATLRRPFEVQGLKVDRYSCAPELRGNSGGGISRIGPHCHEIGHALGAMDYYDTDYSTNGEFTGTGKWDVMASGSWNNDGITPADFNPYVKAYNFGWIKPKVLPYGKVSISPSCDDPESYYILRFPEHTDYYLLENRSKEKWGAGLPGEGLLIYHIHSDIVNAGNEINASAPQKCYIVCASSKYQYPSNLPNSYGNINSDGAPYPGRTGNKDFGQYSTPKAFFWDDNLCNIEINDIHSDGIGHIILINNSEGTSFEPTDMRRLLFEGFEDKDNLLVQGAVDSYWKIEDNPDNTAVFIDRPVAYEGFRSLQLSAVGSKTDITDTLDFVCTSYNDGRIRIKLWVSSMSVQFNKSNNIQVAYRTTDNTDWQYVELASSNNQRWHQSYIDLPQNLDSKYRIIGTVRAGSVMAIDNLEIEQEIPNDSMGLLEHRFGKGNVHISHLFGTDGLRTSVLRRGINIIRSSDGSTRKVLVK
ncbi:MAG: M6 family metalloprotease domain-containing protein [Bacteroidaceae bacterium]|nr:M6 family metalloprotease domain-containing protein [Bacteroidaceae bacterium]